MSIRSWDSWGNEGLLDAVLIIMLKRPRSDSWVFFVFVTNQRPPNDLLCRDRCGEATLLALDGQVASQHLWVRCPLLVPNLLWWVWGSHVTTQGFSPYCFCFSPYYLRAFSPLHFANQQRIGCLDEGVLCSRTENTCLQTIEIQYNKLRLPQTCDSLNAFCL